MRSSSSPRATICGASWRSCAAARTPVRRLVIAGGGNIGLRLARTLEKNNQVKLIERDPRRARRVSEMLENTIVLHGDAADEELLIEENIDSADVFAALTNSEEANVLSAMLAKRLGARSVMALINRPSYGELMENRSIDVVISPQTITIGSLLAHVRRGDVVRVHSLRRGAAEAIEAVVHGDAERSRVVGRASSEIELPQGASIVAIVRGESVIMAHHDTIIEPEDHVIMFLSDRRHVEAVERLFQARRLSEQRRALTARRRSHVRLAAGVVRRCTSCCRSSPRCLRRDRARCASSSSARAISRAPALLICAGHAALSPRTQAARCLPAGDAQLAGVAAVATMPLLMGCLTCRFTDAYLRDACRA